MFVSVVVPVYESAECLEELCRRLQAVLASAGGFEIILVCDGSPDASWAEIERLASGNPTIKGINLSRNFGQHYALTAGLDHASGDFVIAMDCDLQDRPEDIPALIAKAGEGFDVVTGIGTFRGRDNWLHRMFSAAYYWIFDFLAERDERSFNTSFILMRRKVVEEFRRLRERRRLFLSLLQYLGFRWAKLPVTHDKRPRGRSSYTFVKRLQIAFAGITAGSTRLLRLGILLGLIFSFVSFCSGLFILIERLSGRRDYLLGWSSLIVSIFFVGGILMVLVGILGVYIETTYYEAKQRPLYIVANTVNLGPE